jgi:hypothetical protein
MRLGLPLWAVVPTASCQGNTSRGASRPSTCAVPLWRGERVPTRGGLAPGASPDTGTRQGPAGHALLPLTRLKK